MSFSYDEVLYPGFPRAQAHPDRLAAHAIALGMSPPPLDRCRVLELGCGDGAHLIPIAAAYPESTVVGVDLSAVAIRNASDKVRRVGLRNARFEQMDVMAIGPEFGEFDYILAHGLYTWVPPTVQDHVLAIASANLAPNGVSYISYNALPGCSIRAMTREMLRFRGGSIADARAFITILANSPNAASAVYQSVLADEAKRLEQMSDHSIFHDDLSPEYHPLSFTDFLGRAASHGLQYLAEGDYFARPWTSGTAVSDLFHQLAAGDEVKLEQLIDFQRGRAFRQTLLCHSAISLRRPVEPEVMKRMYFSSSAAPQSAQPHLDDTTIEKFDAPSGTASIQNPLGKTALMRLYEARPAALPYWALVDGSMDDGSLPPLLLQLATATLVRIHPGPVLCTGVISERPRASALARAEIAYGEKNISTWRHAPVVIDGQLGRRLVELCDGTRTLQDIAAQLSLEGEADIGVEDVKTRLGEIARLGLLEA